MYKTPYSPFSPYSPHTRIWNFNHASSRERRQLSNLTVCLTGLTIQYTLPLKHNLTIAVLTLIEDIWKFTLDFIVYVYNLFFLLHAVYRAWHGRQREPGRLVLRYCVEIKTF